MTALEQQRYRLRFVKRDRLRFVSHRDLMQTFERALRRAGLRVKYTEGFNPHPKLSFALALPLGVESHDEIVEFELEERIEPRQLLDDLRNQLPDGLQPFACEAIGLRDKAHITSSDYQVEIPSDELTSWIEAITRFEESDTPQIRRSRKGTTREIALKDFLTNVRIESSRLLFTLSHANDGSLRPGELLMWLGFDETSYCLVKTASHLTSAKPDRS